MNTVHNQMRTLVGHKVELPCDVTVASAEDSVSLILWYKGTSHVTSIVVS